MNISAQIRVIRGYYGLRRAKYDYWVTMTKHFPAIAGAVFISAIFIIFLFVRPSARPTLAPASAIQPQAAAERPRLPGEPTPTVAPLAGDFLQRNQLQVALADGLYNGEEQERLASDLDRALSYVVSRFGTGPSAPIIASIAADPGCGIHGIAYTDVRTTQVFSCQGIPRSRVVNIMAHEFVHQLAHDRYGDRHLSADMILLEGVATWGAGSYWLSGQPNYRSFVHEMANSGALLPLATSYVGRSIGDMNTLYYQWASFVEFLIENYGRERFDALYITGSSAPGSADFYGVYGKSLPQLEQEWQLWIADSR
jgi:hypothetical protein